MVRLFITLMIFPIFIFGQTHSIDTLSLQMTGTTNFNNISTNTYYNTYDSCSITWRVIDVSTPSDWEFSLCYPNCYNVGVTSGQNNFLPNYNIYLGCHFYPNGTAGVGELILEITTNEFYIDTVVFEGFVNTAIATSTYNKNQMSFSNTTKIYDLFGRSVEKITSDGVYIIEHNNLFKKVYYRQ